MKTLPPVRNCAGCPFSDWREMDAHCKAADRSLPTDGEEGDMRGPVMPRKRPSWCPLPLTVRPA